MLGIEHWNCAHEHGMPCNRGSPTHDEYVPALCTHRPSLLPIEWLGEKVGLMRGGLVSCLRTEHLRTRPFRGSTSRNKVSVGEPAEGSQLKRVKAHDPLQCRVLHVKHIVLALDTH